MNSENFHRVASRMAHIAPFEVMEIQTAARELGHALGMKSTMVTLDLESFAGEPVAPQEIKPMGTGVSQ